MYYSGAMETIIFRVRKGTKAKLKEMGNISALMREQIDRLLSQSCHGSAHEKARHLCGSASGSRDASTSKDYLKQYAKESAD